MEHSMEYCLFSLSGDFLPYRSPPPSLRSWGKEGIWEGGVCDFRETGIVIPALLQGLRCGMQGKWGNVSVRRNWVATLTRFRFQVAENAQKKQKKQNKRVWSEDAQPINLTSFL